MQKDEDDILEEWILYHSYLFGLENLHIIDNFSGPASLRILEKYKALGLHVFQLPDYSKKGEYLCELIKKDVSECDFAIPLDIDEFVAVVDSNNIPFQYLHELTKACLSLDQNYYVTRYPQVQTEAKSPQAIYEHFIKKGFRFQWSSCPENKKVSATDCRTFLEKHTDMILKYYPNVTISCERDQILSHLEQLPKYGRYSFLYYLTSRNSEIDYDNPIQDVTTFDLVDYEHFDGKMNYNKKFFDPKKLISLDHGNHFGRVVDLSQNQYLNTHLVLFHFHKRGVRKLIEKCKNDIKGLGIVKDINDQRELREKIKQKVIGSHNIETYLTYLTSGAMSLCVIDDEGFTINHLARKIKDIKDI